MRGNIVVDRWRAAIVAAALMATVAATAPAAAQETGDPAFAERFTLLGQVQSRSARDIADNPWSIGAEAIDRDYSTYDKWRAYLGPLGVKRARVQSGWARTDAGGGRYDFGWLDPVIDGIRADGVVPWMSLSYGNERYVGGGTSRRDSPLPSGAGRAAWLAYVKATATRYRGRVAEYEIWNEPDLNPLLTAEGYGRFAFETAAAVRAADPKARIVFGAFAHGWSRTGPARAFATTALRTFMALGGRADALTYHAYAINPDAVYADVEDFLATIRAIDPRIEVRQGENGAPSLNQAGYALRNLWWTEETQAKWLLRRMLGDWARGVPTSISSLTEMHYAPAAEMGLTWQKARGETRAIATAKQYKGLLETRRYAPGTPEDDRTVVRTKMGYVAMQAVTAIFDSALRPVPVRCTVTGTRVPVAVHGFRRADGAAALAVWRSGDAPGDRTMHEAIGIDCPGFALPADARYVDLLTRATYATRGVVASAPGTMGGTTRVAGLPVYDAPVLLVDARLVTAR